MKTHVLFRQQKIPVSQRAAWAFFSDPFNLERITPRSLDFVVESITGDKYLHQGQVITYRLRPLAGIPLTWKSKITQVREPEFFVDEQMQGPYQLWKHTHLLLPVEGGLLMTDQVHYKVFRGMIGSLINHFIVKRKLDEIFNYRSQKIREIFGELQSHDPT